MLDFIAILLGFVIVLGLISSQNKSLASIVLGDKSGQKNAIIVTSKEAEMVVDKPFLMVNLNTDGKISEPIKISPKELKSKFRNVIDATPPKVYRTTLFFQKKMELNVDVSLEVFKILLEIRRREPCVVDIVGYTDTKGSKKENLLISRKRAEKIKTILLQSGVKITKINVFAYGEDEQLIATKNNVSEKRNRRVEVVIR